MAERYRCEAGYWHAEGEGCDHIVPQTPPPNRHGFKVPRDHDTVVLDDHHRVIKSYKEGGFYSDEETAKRRAENKLKYMPAHKREAQQERDAAEAAARAKEW